MLSEHFSEKELGVDGAEHRVVDNAVYLCENILEPIRDHFGVPVHIHDGYRDPVHNAKVGGKSASFHLFENGHAAADFDVAGVDLKTTFDWIRLESKLLFDKVILEHGPNGQPATVHIQTDCLNPPRRQAFTGSTGAGTVYTQVSVV